MACVFFVAMLYKPIHGYAQCNEYQRNNEQPNVRPAAFGLHVGSFVWGVPAFFAERAAFDAGFERLVLCCLPQTLSDAFVAFFACVVFGVPIDGFVLKLARARGAYKNKFEHVETNIWWLNKLFAELHFDIGNVLTQFVFFVLFADEQHITFFGYQIVVQVL